MPFDEDAAIQDIQNKQAIDDINKKEAEKAGESVSDQADGAVQKPQDETEGAPV